MKRLTVLLMMLAACACGIGDLLTGGGSERPNPAFSDSEIGTGTATGDVYAVSADSGGYVWDAVGTAGVDDSGYFSLAGYDPGYYAVVMITGSTGGGFSGYVYHDTETVSGRIETAPLKNIAGIIYDSTGSWAANVILGLVGTPYYDTVRAGDNGTFAFDDVPAAEYKMEIGALSLVAGALHDTSTYVDAVDSLRANPGVVAVSNTYISVPGTAPAGTVYVTGYDALPLYSAAVDTVSATGTSIDVVNDAYRIKILTY